MKKPQIDAIYPLSSLQQGILFHSLAEANSGVYWNQYLCELNGALEVTAFRRAGEYIMKRHAVLRTAFVWENREKPLQVVLGDVQFPWMEVDLSIFSDEEKGEKMEELARQELERGVDLSKAPLMRFVLVRLAADRHRLIWSHHHLLLDGWSLHVVMKEWFEAYEAILDGKTLDRPEVPPYRSFINWLQAQRFEDSEGVWRRALSGFTAPTPLTVAGIGVTPGCRETCQNQRLSLSRDATQAMTAFAREHRLTVNTLAQAAWALLLSRYSGESDVMFGSTVAGRPAELAGAESMVGLFINTIPLRVQLHAGDVVLPWLQELQKAQVALRQFENTPLKLVQTWSEVPRGVQMFDSILVFENYPVDERLKRGAGGLEIGQVSFVERTNFPLTASAFLEDSLTLQIIYRADQFTSAIIERLLSHWRNLLEGLATYPKMRVAELPMLSPVERREVIEQFSSQMRNTQSVRTRLDEKSTLHELFEDQAKRSPKRIAVTCGEVSLSYAELDRQAERVAGWLRASGVGPDVLVGLCLDRSNELIIALLGILKAGGGYLPIDLAYPADRLAFMLEDAQAPVLLTEKKLSEQIPATKAKVLFIEELLSAEARLEQEVERPSDPGCECLAYVIYTSGTTGQPKGAMITHRNVTRLFCSTEAWFKFDEHDVWTLFHSSAFDFSVWEIWGALLYGGRLVVVPFMVTRSPEAFYGLLADEGVTVLNQTPSAFRQLVQAEESVGLRDLALRYIIFGGEALEMQSLRPWFDRHGDKRPQLVNMYGITETTVHVTYRPITRDDLGSGSVIGVPLPDLQIYVLDKEGQPVPIGVPGEMHVGGAGLARGYLRRPELTNERFPENHLTGIPGERLYKTGDLVRYLPAHDIEYLGRIDHQVKIRGFRIELGEIESVLSRHPLVREAVVLAREEEGGIKRLVAYIVASAPIPPLTELREHLRRKMPDYMVPSGFVFLEKLPLTNNGKLDQKALPKPETERPALASSYVAPRNETEEKLAQVWTRVLRVERVGVHDNFFELGGDSILSIQIISLARREGVGISPKLLFQHQTIAELASFAELAVNLQKAEQGLVEGTAPLTPIQRWFFEQKLTEAHHYNQAFLFETKGPIDSKIFGRAVANVERHHDALRTRFLAKSTEEQSFTSITEASFEVVNARDLTENEAESVISEVTNRSQRTLDYRHGPVWRVVHFDCGASRAGRVFVAVHHLVVDGVSWRVLLEDLEEAYLQEASGQALRLPLKTTGVKEWAIRLAEMARKGEVPGGREYWQKVASGARRRLPVDIETGDNTEGSTETLTLQLSAEETAALLQRAPSAYSTQINDLLLAALARGLREWVGGRYLSVDLEGHGREELFEGADLSRTVGWFTSIFPVLFEIEEERTGDLIKSIKEQMRSIPARGVGYGIQRYLVNDPRLREAETGEILFNYLGQFDQVISGSKIFSFANEPIGPLHSPAALRRYLLEITCIVVNERLEIRWIYSKNRHRHETMALLANRFASELRRIITHCTAEGNHGATPSDFPLVSLGQRAVDDLMERVADIEDLYSLSPLQTLFYAVGGNDPSSILDHWHGTLNGPLEISTFRRAWDVVIARHPILRASFMAAGLMEPIQVIHKTPALGWRFEDWRAVSKEARERKWLELLEVDRELGIKLDCPPLLRLALIQLDDERYKFLWTVPALLLDGWSWPVVFRELSHAYEAICNGREPSFQATRPYGDYLMWLRAQESEEAEKFWRQALNGVKQPTPLPAEAIGEGITGANGRGEWSGVLDDETSERLVNLARRLKVTTSALIQAGWGIVLARLSGQSDVIFGAAFAGRPPDLHGSEGIVGPFVNNLPVRAKVDRTFGIQAYLQEVHANLLKLNSYQFSPMALIQSWSDVPWQHRLFDNLVVVQNYLVGDDARQLGSTVSISEFVGPVHSNVPLLLLVEPETSWRVSVVYDQREFPRSSVVKWGEDFMRTLAALSDNIDSTIDTVLSQLLTPAAGYPIRTRRRVQSQNYVPPQTDLERAFASIWEEMLQLEKISIEENVFELGVQSLLVVQLHRRLCEKFGRDFPLILMFQYPTIHLLAGCLTQNEEGNRDEQIRNRAQLQRRAMARLQSASARR